MRGAAIRLAVAVLNLGGSGQALGQGYKLDYPKEAFGFRGTLAGQVARAPDPVYGWFEMKVIKVVSFAPGNRTRLRAPQALTRAWKGKYVAVLGVKGMGPLKVGDLVTVVVFNREVHLRASKVSKDRPIEARPDGAGTAANEPRPTFAQRAEAYLKYARGREQGPEKAPPARPTPKTEAEAREALLVARDLLNRRQDLLGFEKLEEVVEKYPGTRAAKEAREWMAEWRRHEKGPR